MARPVNAVIIGILMSATALSAVAQGQTPTTPQQGTEPRVRPAPSSGIPWDGDDSSSRRLNRSSSTDTGTDSSRGTSGTTSPGSRSTGVTSQPTRRGGAASSASSTPTTSGQQAGKTPAEKAAADTGPGREPPKARSGGAGPRMIGGGSSGGGATVPGLTGASGLPGAGAAGAGIGAAGGGYGGGGISAVTMTGEGAFEPVMEREPEYKDVPEAGEKITLEGPMPLAEFLAAINLATNWNVVISPVLQDIELRFWIFDVTPKQALEVLKFNEIFYEFDEETKFLRIMTEEEYLTREYGKKKPHEFNVEFADVAYVESMIGSLLSSTGRAITDQRTNNIYVWDTDDNIKEMVRIVGEIDVPLQKAEFTIEHAEVADMEAVLATFMSPSGSVLADVRTGQIFVWDSPAILDKMRAAVTRLDQPVESRTFFVENVNSEDVVDSVEAMLTERGTIQVDPRFNSIVVTDLPTRVERIAAIIETLDKELETRTWVLKYADLDFVADQIEAYIPGEMGQIVVQDEVHQITVTGLPGRLNEIDKLITTWDVKRKQVLIEAHIVEVSTDVERAFNVNWSTFSSVGGSPFAMHSGSGAGAPATASGSGQIASAGGQPYAVPRYGALQVDDSGGILRPLLEDISGETIIDRYVGRNLAVTLDCEEAIFENATKVPYVSSTGGYGGYYGGYYGSNTNTDNSYNRYSASTSRVEFIDVGTILSVLPRVTEDSNILLDISAEDSTYTDKNVVVDDLTRSVPEKTVRQADTQVRVNSGDTIVLGGLRRDRADHSTTRTPILGDIPVIGRLFNNPKRKSANSTLLIFITTTIVDERTMPESMEIARVDAEIADAQRQMNKGVFGRMKDKIYKGQNEIGVSIGHTGVLHCAGEIATVDELRDRFFDVGRGGSVTVVIRKHPSAPVQVVNEVTEAAMEAELHIEFDSTIPPIVPAVTPEE